MGAQNARSVSAGAWGSFLGAIAQTLRGFGPSRLAAMGVVTLALIGFFVFISMRLSQPQMVPVFSDLAMSDAAAVVRELESQTIPYEMSRDGSTVLVPTDRLAAVRMALAERGLPSGGGVGWEIFDKGDGLSATSFLQNVNRLRALEGELARSIRSLGNVAAARVHLVVPERPLFSRDAPKPTASIVLRVRGELGAGQVRAIQHLTASAVEGLDPGQISIIDEAGRLLANGGGAEQAGMPAGADERETAVERRLKSQVEGIVERVVGTGRARAEISAQFDYGRVTQTADTFDPESRVVRSTQTREESGESREGNQQVSVGNDLPNADPNTAEGTNGERNQKAEETVNYEISRTTRTEVIEGGRLKRVSVAVLVDGVYTQDPSGNVAYQPRTQEELDRIAALVRTAIGFDEARGDQIEVVNLRFADPPASPAAIEEEFSVLGFGQQDLMRLIELGTLAIVALLVLLVVVRPLVTRILTREAGAADQPLLAAPVAQAALPAPAQPSAVADPAATSRAIDVSQLNGRVHAESVQRVGELVQRNPNETVSIVRQWLAEPA